MKFLVNVDNLGRVVIPSNLLENLDMKKGEQVVIVSYDHELKIVKAEPSDKAQILFCL